VFEPVATQSKRAVQSLLQANLERVRARIAAAASAAGRAGDDVTLLAVTKAAPASLVAELVRLGQHDLGENRVDVLAPKAAALGELGLSPRWHMIGHLQRNKARRAVEFASVVHSVDTLQLIETLSRLAGELAREVEVFLEVRAVEAGERSGFVPNEIPAAAHAVASLPHLRLRGLMAMAAPCESARAFDLDSQAPARRTFAALRGLGEALPKALFSRGRVEYSMGMSADLEAAVAEGSTCVRVGAALFEDLDLREAQR